MNAPSHCLVGTNRTAEWKNGMAGGGRSRAGREGRIIGTRDESHKKCSPPHDDSGLLSVTKAQHQVSAAERALLVGVGWKRTPRFPGMPVGEQGRESLLELVELARSAGAEVAGTVFQVRESADPA